MKRNTILPIVDDSAGCKHAGLKEAPEIYDLSMIVILRRRNPALALSGRPALRDISVDAEPERAVAVVVPQALLRSAGASRPCQARCVRRTPKPHCHPRLHRKEPSVSGLRQGSRSPPS